MTTKGTLLTLLIFSLFTSLGQTKKICITIDDLPTVTYGQNNIEYSKEITKKLIHILNQFHIPAIGFINEGQLYTNERPDSEKISLVELWLQNGYDIGNHTYSHPDYNKVSDSAYFRNIIQGELISRPLMKKYGKNLNYFRHPFLHTGSDKVKHKALNDFLKKHHYIVSPVTIDNDDYLFARFYHKAFLDNNTHLMKAIGDNYILYMEKKLIYFEGKSNEVFNRNIAQTLLLHASLLNADYLDELAVLFQKHGYTFVSQKEILKDEAYKTSESYYTAKGISWIFRWGISKGMDEKIMDNDIPTPDYIINMKEDNPTLLNYEVVVDTLSLFDQSRQRKIPVAIYKPKTNQPLSNQKVVIFSHGYGQNKGGDYLAYSYLTSFLASKGFFVISIQHELTTDSLLPLTGNPQILRLPFWERGADNINFVITNFKKTHPELDYKHITLIGHSNGADMTALFPQKYPNIVNKIITLDNRRMTLPRTKNPKVYSLRSSDQPADAGVLPSKEEIATFDITIIQLVNTTHNEMDDNANIEQRKEIQEFIIHFLLN